MEVTNGSDLIKTMPTIICLAYSGIDVPNEKNC
jgi:hypothetical protein